MLKTISCIFILSLVLPAAAQENWPEFRGPDGTGRVVLAPSQTEMLPLHWDESKNIVWKTAIPHKGWSTPAVLENQIWLTTATVEGHDFYAICIDKRSGKIIFSERLFHSDSPEPLGNDLNSYASPSAVVEQGRAYLHFGSYGTACLNSETFEVIWKRDDLPCRHYRGPGSSPVLYEDLLILTMDGVDQQYLAALDKNTGKTVWRTDRRVDFDDLGSDGQPMAEGDFRKAYSTPLIITFAGERQMLTLGAKAVYSYHPRTGAELWTVRHDAFSGAARPVYGAGLAYFATGFAAAEVIAVRVDGKGDVTNSHIRWRTQRGVPEMPSPVLDGEWLYWVNDKGIVVCVNSGSGEELWRKRIGGQFSASMIQAGNRLYCFDRDGTSTILQAGREPGVLASNKLDQGMMASPAVSKRSLYLRTKTHLYRIQKPPTNQNLFDTAPYIPEHNAKRRAMFDQEKVGQGRIVFLGNSITEGGDWAHLSGDTTVVNRGIGGDITYGVLDRLDDITRLLPSRLFIMIGINDIGKDIPDEVIVDNYEKIIERIQAECPATEIIVQSLLPVNPAYPGFPQHYAKTEHVLRVNRMLTDLCARMNCRYVNLYPLFVDQQQRLNAQYTGDGLHLNQAGYQHWVQHLKKLGLL